MLDEAIRCQPLPETFPRYKSCTRGVPQGSVLDSMLLCLYIRQIKSCLLDYVKNLELAVDIMPKSTESDIKVATANLSVAVTNLSG